MKLFLLSLTLFFLSFLLASYYSKAQKTDPVTRLLSPADMLKDFDILRAALDESCSFLYVYKTKAQVEKHFEELRQELNTPMTVGNLYVKFGKALSFIQDGHLRAFIENDYYYALVKRDCLLPARLKFLDGKIYVLRNMSGNPLLKEGSEIISINSKNAEDVLAAFGKFTGSDGDNVFFKYRKMDTEHRLFFAIFFDLPEQYILKIRAGNAKSPVQEITVKGMNLKDLTKAEEEKYGKDSKTTLFAIDIKKESSTAVFRFDTFGDQDGEKKLREIMKDLVTQCNDNNIRHLIIDIRNNSEGFDGNVPVVFSYLTDKPFYSVKGRYLKTNAISFTQYLLDKKINDKLKSVPMKAVDNEYKLDMPLDNLYQPNPVNFKGNIYLLVSNRTFSTPALFVNIFQRLQRGKIIGAGNIGGGYKGDSGGSLFMVLPNTGLTIQLMLARNEYITEESKKDWVTILPDYKVELTIDDILNKKDREMEKAYTLISQTGN